MKRANSNPMGKASTSGKPDGAVLRMMSAKVSPNLNTGNKVVPTQAKLNPPTAKASGVNSMDRGILSKPVKSKFNRKARTK